jgi:hypothetical protein
MAVVTGKSDLIRDYLAGDAAPDPMRLKGRRFIATGTVANGATDSNLSMYHLIDLPSDCILDEDTAFDVENWGFAQVVIGTQTDTDALLDVARAAATTQRPIVFGDANHAKELWEVLGLAADPGGEIGIWAHAEAGATGAGTMPFQMSYRYR